MTKTKLLELINTQPLDKKVLLTWASKLPNDAICKPNSIKIGDIFMHNALAHPIVIFRYKNKKYICGLLTSNENCKNIIEKVKCRFSTGYFTTVLLEEVEFKGRYMGFYENKKHLKEVYNKIVSRLIL